MSKYIFQEKYCSWRFILIMVAGALGSFGQTLRGETKRDCLIHAIEEKAKVTQLPGGKEIVLENELIRRTFRVSPNGATVGFDNLMTGASILRGVKPEMKIEIEGVTYEVGGLEGKVDGIQEVALAEPHAGGNQPAVRHGVVGGGIFDVPPVFHRLGDLSKAPALRGHRDHQVQALAVRRLWMDQPGGPANDCLRVCFKERKAHHAGDEDGPVRSFCVTVDVAKIAR